MRTALVIMIILGFGFIRLPLEHSIAQEHKNAYFRSAELGLGLREQIGQLSYLAALSGFRSLVADAMWIQAHSAWERTEWGKMYRLFNNVTTLQPRMLMFWDMAAWHMAWNASVAAMNDESQPREALRVREQWRYFDLGKDFLERGIKNNPDRYLLYERLGVLYRDKYQDYCNAAEQFGKAAAIEGSPAYNNRFYGYMLAKCEGKEKEAYEHLKLLYDSGEDQHLPSLITSLVELEEKLNIPQDQRINKKPQEQP